MMSDNNCSYGNWGHYLEDNSHSISICYALYMHRQELGRPKRRLMQIAGTKLNLTNELILRQKQLDQEKTPTMQERNALNRESRYRDVLKRGMQHQLERQLKRQSQKLLRVKKLEI